MKYIINAFFVSLLDIYIVHTQSIRNHFIKGLQGEVIKSSTEIAYPKALGIVSSMWYDAMYNSKCLIFQTIYSYWNEMMIWQFLFMDTEKRP